MGYTPHNPFGPPKDEAFPTPDPHQDEAAELGRAYRSPLSAVVAMALALIGLAACWFGASFLVVRLVLAGATVMVAAVAWRAALRSHKPAGVAIAALGLGLSRRPSCCTSPCEADEGRHALQAVRAGAHQGRAGMSGGARCSTATG